MKLFYAGADKKAFRDILQESGVKNILMSFYWTTDEEVREASRDFSIFMDSGGYSARKNGVDISIQKYGEFLNRNKDRIFTAANLDVYDLNTALQNQEYLEQFYPVLPVYHYTEYAKRDEKTLLKFLENYSYIAIGGIAGMNLGKSLVKNFLNYVFRRTIKYKVKVHGFGITALYYLKEYPFYSVDSTSWLTGGQYGQILKWNNEDFSIKTTIHYSNREEFLKSNFDINLTKNYTDRCRHNARELLKLETSITKLWRERGIDYDKD